jgi:PAS domain S-box-containing protein
VSSKKEKPGSDLILEKNEGNPLPFWKNHWLSLLLPRMENAETARISRLILILGSCTILSLLVAILPNLWLGQWDSAVILALQIPLMLVVVDLNRRGRIRLASVLFLLTLVTFTFVLMVRSKNGFHDPAVFTLPGILVVAGLFFQNRNYLWVVAFIDVCSIFLGFGEISGLVANSMSQHTTWSYLLDFLLVLNASAFAVGMLAKDLHSSIVRLQQKEITLRESETKFRLLAENASDMITRLDSAGKILYISPSCFIVLGYFPDELVGKEFQEFVHSTGTSGEIPPFNGLLNKPGMHVYVRQFLRKDGSETWLETTARSLVDPVTGGILEVHASSRDISARRTAEEALRQSEQKYRSLFEISNDAIFMADVETGIILDCNARAAEMVGLPQEKIIGLHQTQLHPPEYEVEAATSFRQSVDNQRAVLTGVSVLRANGERIPIEVSSSVMEIHGRKVVMGNFRDISDRLKAEEERLRLETQIQHAQRMEAVGHLAGGVAHDFNNMLGVILGHTELALERVDPVEPLHADLEQIRLAAQRSADLTRQLLAFASAQTVAPRVLDLNETVEGMLKMLRRLIGENIDLIWKPDARCPQVKIDPSQLDQILANLTVNARDAISGVGQVTIETANVVFDSAYCDQHTYFVPGEYVMLMVSDTGCGMDKGTLSHIFEPFFTTKEFGRGTGLGLATLFGIVKQNQGFINVYSEPGQGTTFKIYLPHHADSPPAAAVKEIADARETGRETILLVEDDPALLNLSTVLLKKLGYSVLSASAPGEAIVVFGEHAGRIDLLMTDVVMPEMNGHDLAQHLFSISPNLQCLFMSGYPAKIIGQGAVIDEGIHFIQKPFSLNSLAGKLREVLERNRVGEIRSEESVGEFEKLP